MRATTDEGEALKLLAARIEELEHQPPPTGQALLGTFAVEFIRRKPGGVTDRWLHDMELRQVIAIFLLQPNQHRGLRRTRSERVVPLC